MEHIPASGQSIGEELRRLLLADNEKEQASKEVSKISREDLEAHKVGYRVELRSLCGVVDKLLVCDVKGAEAVLFI